MAFTGHPVVLQRTFQVIDDVVCRRATAVKTLVNHSAFTADLGKEVAVE
jgi:hypothetical protein